jgi:hypothetical protein
MNPNGERPELEFGRANRISTPQQIVILNKAQRVEGPIFQRLTARTRFQFFDET